METWFVSQARREYFGVESQLIYLPTNSQKNLPPAKMN